MKRKSDAKRRNAPSRALSKKKTSRRTRIVAVFLAISAILTVFALYYLTSSNTVFLNVAGYTLYVRNSTTSYYPATHVSATFKVPAVLPVSGNAEQMAFISNDKCWNGNGSACRIVEGGTRSEFYNGSIHYFSFFYLYPNVYLPVFAVNPNDTVNVNITESVGDSWHIHVIDYTNGKNFSIINYFPINGTWANVGMTEWLIECNNVSTVKSRESCKSGPPVTYEYSKLDFYNISATIGNMTYDLCTAELTKRDIVYPANTLNPAGLLSSYAYRIIPNTYSDMETCRNFTILINR